MRIFNKVGWRYGITRELGSINDKRGDNVFIKFGMDAMGRKYFLAMVADGFKGNDDEKMASKYAVDEVKKWWDQRISYFLKYRKPIKYMEEEMENVFRKINNDLYQWGKEKDKEIVTDLSLLFLIDDYYIVVHVGDNRIYKIRKKHIELVNRFSLIINDLTNEQPDESIHLTNETNEFKQNLVAEKKCLGQEDKIIIHKLQGQYKIGDLFILSSDGFNNYMNEYNLRTMLYAHGKEKNLQYLSDLMVQLVKKMGSTEDTTAIIVQRTYSSMNFIKRYFTLIVGKITKISVKIKEASRLA